jgi:hypothetical protein
MNTKNKVKLHQHLLVYDALGTGVLFWLNGESFNNLAGRLQSKTDSIWYQQHNGFHRSKKTNSKGIPRYFLPAEGGLKGLKLELECIMSS